MILFDRKTYFDNVRANLFSGSLTQQQVDGQTFILNGWETHAPGHDVRWLANFLAQTFHETGEEMWPIAEYNKGEGQPYGVPDPVTGQAYYGRGFIQLTWKDNYARADDEFGLTGDDSCVWNADLQLDPMLSARTGYRGMMEAWFRPPHQFDKYFNLMTDDPYNARDIINGDKTLVPSWSGGVSIGNLIKGYHGKFLAALKAAADAIQQIPFPTPTPVPPHPEESVVTITTTGRVTVIVNGRTVTGSAVA